MGHRVYYSTYTITTGDHKNSNHKHFAPHFVRIKSVDDRSRIRNEAFINHWSATTGHWKTLYGHISDGTWRVKEPHWSVVEEELHVEELLTKTRHDVEKERESSNTIISSQVPVEVFWR